jgi:hypothetical protein
MTDFITPHLRRKIKRLHRLVEQRAQEYRLWQSYNTRLWQQIAAGHTPAETQPTSRKFVPDDEKRLTVDARGNAGATGALAAD